MNVYRNFPKLHSPCVLTIGNYDGMHLGHQALIDRLILEANNSQKESSVMTFEPHPREFFSPTNAPTRIISLREKLEFFESKNIDRIYVIKFNKDFSLMSGNDFVFKLKNQIIAEHILVGDDFRFGKNRESGVDEIIKSGIKVTTLNEVKLLGERVSSTLIRNALASGELIRAQSFLGRPYAISGKVIHGKKKGRELGFPTANIHMLHNRPPLKGVFIVKLDNKYGVANLGTRPTISGINKLHLEVHVLNFSEDLYGQHVHVTFLKKLRDEKKFKSIDKLKTQIKLDVQEAQTFLSKL